MTLADELAKLDELRRNGALTETEFAQAKSKLLDAQPAVSIPSVSTDIERHLSEQLAETRYANDLAALDRAWDLEQRNYLVMGRYGQRIVPTPGMGRMIMLVGGIGGILWTCLAISITGSGPDFGAFSVAKYIFPAFGVLFIIAALVFGAYCNSKARQYADALARYRRRRQQLTGDTSESPWTDQATQ